MYGSPADTEGWPSDCIDQARPTGPAPGDGERMYPHARTRLEPPALGIK
jgi:hypothetical protein